MKRSNILSLISIFLMTIILAPTVVRLLDDNDNSILAIELNEEENKEKGANGMDEEGHKIYYISVYISSLIEEKKTISTSYMIKKYNYTRDILLPPPRLNV